MQQQLEEQLDGKSTELDAFEKRLPMPAGKEPTIKEKLSREYVSDLFLDKKKDTTIKVKDTQYGKQKVEEIKKLEAEIKQIEDSDISEPQKIIALDIKTKQHNKLSVQVEERASADLLKSEKQHIKNELAKTYRGLAKDAKEELDQLTSHYKIYRAAPVQVAGLDGEGLVTGSGTCY